MSIDGEPSPYFQRLLILVAEDDADLRLVLWQRLTRAGYRVRLAADGAEALHRVRMGLAFGPRLTPSAVVTDLRMAGTNGLDLLAQLRNLDPKLPVIVITAFGEPEVHEEARRLGAHASLDKPVEFAALLDAIRAATRRRAGGAA